MSDTFASALVASGGVLLAAVLTSVIGLLQQPKTLRSVLVAGVFVLLVFGYLSTSLILAPLTAMDPIPSHASGVDSETARVTASKLTSLLTTWAKGVIWSLAFVVAAAFYKVLEATPIMKRLVKRLFAALGKPLGEGQHDLRESWVDLTEGFLSLLISVGLAFFLVERRLPF